MINALVISNNIHFIKRLLKESNRHNLSIKFAEIATRKSETITILKEFKPDIIFLDKSIQRDYVQTFLHNYRNIIITFLYQEDSNLISERTLREVKRLIENSDFEKKKLRIAKELEYIGYKFKYKGTHYLLDTILQMYARQNSMVDNLQTHIYPIIAKKYNKTIYNVKSSINKATECMYYECDAERLEKYFQFDEDTKPTIKQVVFTVINKI